MTDKWFRVVKVLGQGYGIFSPEDWAAVPEIFRERVEVLELVSDQRSATECHERLVQAAGDGGWQDKPLRRHKVNGQWQEKVHGQWREDTKLVVNGMRVYMPVDAPLPVIEEIPPELYTLADILSKLPPDRARAEIRALDWCCENYATQSQNWR